MSATGPGRAPGRAHTFAEGVLRARAGVLLDLGRVDEAVDVLADVVMRDGPASPLRPAFAEACLLASENDPLEDAEPGPRWRAAMAARREDHEAVAMVAAWVVRAGIAVTAAVVLAVGVLPGAPAAAAIGAALATVLALTRTHTYAVPLLGRRALWEVAVGMMRAVPSALVVIGGSTFLTAAMLALVAVVVARPPLMVGAGLRVLAVVVLGAALLVSTVCGLGRSMRRPRWRALAGQHPDRDHQGRLVRRDLADAHLLPTLGGAVAAAVGWRALEVMARRDLGGLFVVAVGAYLLDPGARWLWQRARGVWAPDDDSEPRLSTAVTMALPALLVVLGLVTLVRA